MPLQKRPHQSNRAPAFTSGPSYNKYRIQTMKEVTKQNTILHKRLMNVKSTLRPIIFAQQLKTTNKYKPTTKQLPRNNTQGPLSFLDVQPSTSYTQSFRESVVLQTINARNLVMPRTKMPTIRRLQRLSLGNEKQMTTTFGQLSDRENLDDARMSLH